MATLARLAGIDVSEVKGLGGPRSATLKKHGVVTVADLLHNVPRRYIDRSNKELITNVVVGVEVTLVGEVRSVNTRRPKKGLAMIEAMIADESATIKAIWFNQVFRVKQLQPGTQVALSGVVESFRGNLQMKSPDVDVLDSPTESLLVGRVVPVHPATASAKPGIMRRAIHNALVRSRPIDDPVPAHLLKAHDLMSRDEAFATIHFPESMDQVRPARTRLVYDEFLRLSIAFALRKRRQESEASGIEHSPTGELLDRFLGGLPYALTGAQKTVLGEILEDLRKPPPMHRMLQGEVGSGKTVVAVAAMLSAIEGRWQTAIMAPTEVLAEQHFLGVVDLLAQAGLSPDILGMASDLGMDSLFGADGPAVHVALLTGSTATTNYSGRVSRSQLLLDVKSGQVDLLVGTHALIQDGVEFARLGAAVVDEQHRFGVSQRVMLKEKADGAEPDLLIMTATPIPRTIAMSVYGDLDVSTIDEMPPGRTPVRTKLLPRSEEQKAWAVLKKEVEGGRQGFVVCPLVDDSPKIEAVSATAEHERITSLLPGVRVGLIHGQMPSQEKEAAMAAFRDGEIDVLVATTVIEVGIDVPNATVMVIEDADRFGLSQLHQLRGRVGRGKHPGVCILLADATTDEGQERMTAMVESNDGFELANTDLRIRGQGTVFGTRQSGMTDFKIADVLADTELLHKARRDAFALVESDPELRDHPELATEIRAMLGDRVEWLFVS
jgi:ATP-dependent DNA helicase RecG